MKLWTALSPSSRDPEIAEALAAKAAPPPPPVNAKAPPPAFKPHRETFDRKLGRFGLLKAPLPQAEWGMRPLPAILFFLSPLSSTVLAKGLEPPQRFRKKAFLK